MKRLALLDYGRFIAALSVVSFHYLFSGIANGKISSITLLPGVSNIAKYGYLGVDLFFMISGYVIFFSAKNRTAGQFAVSRAVRLYPAFWFAVLFTSCFALVWGGARMGVHLSQVLANLTMAAPLFNREFVDGVYWTLILELQFYLLVLALLVAGLRHALERLFLAWPFVIALALYFDKDHLPYLGGYFCYFSAGAVWAVVKDKRSIFSCASLAVAFVLCLVFATGKAAEFSMERGSPHSAYVIGLAVCMFFGFFLAANTERGARLNLFGATLLGGLTYPIYLIHAHFGYMVIDRFATDRNKIGIYMLTLTIVMFVAYFIHRIVEQKFAGLWQRLFRRLLGTPIEKASAALGAFVTAYRRRSSADS